MVTAACTDTVAETELVGESTAVDFAHRKRQLSRAQVLEQLGLSARLRGKGPQRRGPCPLHDRGRAKARSFSVHLGKDVFQCFHPPCAAHGNVLDLWVAVRGVPLYEAAHDLAATLHVELPLLSGTEKRNP